MKLNPIMTPHQVNRGINTPNAYKTHTKDKCPILFCENKIVVNTH